MKVPYKGKKKRKLVSAHEKNKKNEIFNEMIDDTAWLKGTTLPLIPQSPSLSLLTSDHCDDNLNSSDSN